jgi:hypothetical protein
MAVELAPGHAQRRTVRQDDCTLDDILQLANVAWPRRPAQQFHALAIGILDGWPRSPASRSATGWQTTCGRSPGSANTDDFPHGASRRERLTFLCRYAILAPSTMNTQPWTFRVKNDEVELRADLSTGR